MKSAARKHRVTFDGVEAVMDVIGLVIASVAWLAMVAIFVGFFAVLTYEFWRAVL